MSHISFEEFLHRTNAEELIVKKMKEAGPRIYQINYDRRFKHCKVLYKKFYDVKLRDTVLSYGLVLKPMPNSFKAKFLEYPQKNNNEGEHNSTEKLENKLEKKRKKISPPLEDKYKHEGPSTSSAFVYKPRIIPTPEKSKAQTKTKPKPESEIQPMSKRDTNSSKTYKIPTKSAPKTRKLLEKQRSSNKSPKITNYFTSNASNINVDEQSIPEGNMKLRKRISDPPNENIEIEPQTKRPKISPAKVKEKSKIGLLNSKTNPKDNKNKTKKEKCVNKSKSILYSDDDISDDLDINTNNSIVNLTSEDSRKHVSQSSPDKKCENNNFSPSKTLLPKRNRTEDYGESSNIILKELLKKISPDKVKKNCCRSSSGRQNMNMKILSHSPKNGFTKDEIEQWITEGQKALEDNNKTPYTEARPDKHSTFKEDVSVDYKLQTIKTHPDKVKKYIRYWLKLEIQMRKGINLEATVVSEISRTKILSTLNEMTYEDFQNLINVQRYISHWTSLGKSIDELERNFKNHYTAFIGKEKPWPALHIELEKLQSYLHSKGVKGSIPLKNIPPRLLSFDEVLEKTNIKECISLSCDKPPESYTELLSLCKKEYEKCCCKGVWTDEMKFNDKEEEGGSSQEMSIELFTEPSMPMSPLKFTVDSGNIQDDVAQKELPVLQNLDNSGSSNNIRKELPSNERNEFADHSKNSTTNSTIKQRKSRTYGPKSRRKHSHRSDDELELKINQICGDEEQPVLKNTIEPMVPIDTQELNRILARSQTQPSSEMGEDIRHSERKTSVDIAVCTDSITHSIEKVADHIQRDVREQQQESPIQTKQTSHVTSLPPLMDNFIAPSPNIFANSDETNTKCSNIQMPNDTTKTPPSIGSKKKPLKSSDMDDLMSTTNDKMTDKQPKSSEKDTLIPLSPNIFQSSGESYSKCVDSHLVEVQTQESVYVACESNNDFHTEQNNFSISMNEVSESEDPFGGTIASQEETDVARLNTSYVEGINVKSSENAKVSFGELNIQEESTSATENLNSEQVEEKTIRNTNNSKESMVPKQSSFSCQEFLLEPLETSQSHCEQIPLEKSISVAGNLDCNEVANKTTENNTDSEETMVLKQLLSSVSEESSETINNKQKNDLCSTDTTANPSCETSDIVDCRSTTLEPAPHINTVAENLSKTANNKENGNTVTRSQSTPDVNMGVNLTKTIQNHNKEFPEENIQSMHSEQNSSINSVCFHNTVEHQKDLNADEKQTAAKLTSDHNTVFNKNTTINVNRTETDLNTSAESIRNLKVVIKREIFSQSFSQYDDDVQIIEIPQSEPMVIGDEETAPELLEALLCTSPHTESVPMTIVHTNISHLPSSSIYLDNFLQAQNFPSNFVLTQSQSNLNQSNNVSTTRSSPEVNFSNLNKSDRLEITSKTTDTIYNSSDCHNFKTPHNQKANLDCSANIVLKSHRKRKLHSNEPSCSSKSKDDRQLSEEMSEMSYVSIAPQNIPSEIEFTQTSSKSEESAKHIGKAIRSSIHLRTNKQNKNSGNNSQESEVSMLVCISDSIDETNNTSMNLEQSENIEENIKSEESLKFNKIQDLSSSEQSRDVETVETSKDNPGKGLSWYDILEATKELKFVFEELSGIDEEDVKVEQQFVAALEGSLDSSSDVQLLEESTEDEIGLAVSTELTSNNNLVQNCEGHDKVDDECFSNPSRDITQKQVGLNRDIEKGPCNIPEAIDMEDVRSIKVEQQVIPTLEDSLDSSSDVQLLEQSTEDEISPAVSVELSSNNNLVKNDKEDEECFSRNIAQKQVNVGGDKVKGPSYNLDVIDIEVSKDNTLSIENKNDNLALDYVEENLNDIEVVKENNIAENVNTSVEDVLSVNDSGDVELLDESKEEDNVPVDSVASLSQSSRVINNISKIVVEAESEICDEAEDQLDDNKHIERSIRPIKDCEVRIARVYTLDVNVKSIETNNSKTSGSTPLSPKEVKTYLKRPTAVSKRQIAKVDEDVSLPKEVCKASKMVEYPEVSNLVIQPTEEKLTEEESNIQKLSSKDTFSNKKVISISHDLVPIDNSIAQNMECKDQGEKELDALQDQNLIISTKSNCKHASEPLEVSAETCENWNSKVRKNVALADHSSVNVNGLQLVAENTPTKQGIESDIGKNSETSEDLTIKSPVSGRLKTNVPEVSKNIDETTLSTKSSLDHDKTEKNSPVIIEKPKDKFYEYALPAPSEIFPGPSEVSKKHKNTLEYTDVNSEHEIQEHVLNAFDEIIPSPSQVIDKDKNTSEDATYSQSFGKKDNTNVVGYTASTQNYIDPATSPNCSVECMDFSFYYISSDDDNNNQNDGYKKEDTLSFKNLLISKKNTTDSSKAINDPNNEELLENLSNVSECVLPVTIPSLTQDGSTELQKVSEATTPMLASEIFLNSNEAASNCNKLNSVIPTNHIASLNLNKSNDSAIFNNFKTTISEENLQKNSLNDVELAELTEKRDFVTMRKPSKDCDPVNRIINDEYEFSKNMPSENFSKQEHLQLLKSLQSDEFEENITHSLNMGCVLNEAIVTNLINNQSSDENQVLNFHERNQESSLSTCSKNLQKAVEHVMKIKRNVNKTIHQRSMSQQHQPVSESVITLRFSEPFEVHHSEVAENISHNPEVLQTSPKSDSQRSFQEPSQEITEITKNNVEPIMSTKLKTITLQGFILTASLQNIQTSNVDFVEVPLMIEKRFLNIIPSMAETLESIQTNSDQKKIALKVKVEVEVDAQQLVEDSIPMYRDELKNPTIPLISCDGKETRKSEEEHENLPKKLPIRLGCKAKQKLHQPSTLKKKTTKLPDFVQQKTHAFPSIPLKLCIKPPKSKPPSLLTVEECDYLIEDASQPIATTISQILGTDCTYFENSELFRNLNEICVPHHPEIPELQTEQHPPEVPTSTPTTSKVINLIPITLSEGVTARKVWQVNLQWKSEKAMSIEVRFSVNRRSMTVCDDSAKLLFTFTPEIWSDVHRVLREINHFEYKRRALKNQLKTTSLHKVLRQLFDSSTQVVDVKLINDNYNPYTICEKTIPVYRKPFQCLTKGIAPDILTKMKFLKEKLQHNNYEVN